VNKDTRIYIRPFPLLPNGTARPGNVSALINMLISRIILTLAIVNMGINGTMLNTNVLLIRKPSIMEIISNHK